MRIMIADDHTVIRQGMKVVLEKENFTVVGEASDGREAIQLAEKLQPDIAILDIGMPNLNGLDAVAEIRRVSPRTRSIILTMYTERAYVLRAIRAGVRGYVLKSQSAADVVQAIREVTRGAVYLSPSISAAVVDALITKTDPAADPLTPRERQVLQLVAEGKTTKDIANFLGISVKTAESHRVRLMQKLDIHETAGLVRYAIREGLIQP